MKAVMISINPKWCELIASGKKTVEVRKTKPKLPTPFKCYIYCTQDKKVVFTNHNNWRGNGMVIGEFVCDRITPLFNICTDDWELLKGDTHEWHKQIVGQACLTEAELNAYAKGKKCFAWHIADLKIYEEPKPLCEFEHPPYLDCDIPCRLCKYGFVVYGAFGAEYDCDRKLKRPPQSWCYVEEV